MAANSIKYPDVLPDGEIIYPEAKPYGRVIKFDIATGIISSSPKMPDGVALGQFALFDVLDN